MSLREIIKVPNPFLKVTAKPVTVINEEILSDVRNIAAEDPNQVNASGNGPVSYTHLTLPTTTIV